jgi:hypothetical protein
MIFNSSEHKRETERKRGKKECTKIKVMPEVRNVLFEGRKTIALLEGSQAWPVRPPDEGSLEARRLEWLETVASDRGNGILVSFLIPC